MKSEILIYKNDADTIKVDVLLQQETVWLTQEQMATLFGKAKSTINEHIGNIYKEGELVKEDTIQKFGNSEFQQKAPFYYNLDVVISVDAILQLNGRELLTHAGKISHQMALNKSGKAYNQYKEQQKHIEKEQSLKEIEEDIKKMMND